MNALILSSVETNVGPMTLNRPEALNAFNPDRLRVHRLHPSRSKGTLWHFNPPQRSLGHVRVPESFGESPEPIIRGDTVWAVTRDELDVARIVRFRVVRP